MGRSRGFDEADVLARAAEAFRTTGYEGTGIDELLVAVGLHRGSLYKAFGSKRGIFVAALVSELSGDVLDDDALDLLLVALLELAPRDVEVRELLSQRLSHISEPELVCGTRLLARAHVVAAPPTA